MAAASGRIGAAWCALVLTGASLILCGCGSGEIGVGMTAEDLVALRRVRSLKINSTTIGVVTGENYPQRAWHDVQRSYTPPYGPLEPSALFAMEELTDQSNRRARAIERQREQQEARREAERDRRERRKRRPEPPKKPTPTSGDPAAAPAAAEKAAAPEAAAEPEGEGEQTAPAAEEDSAQRTEQAETPAQD